LQEHALERLAEEGLGLLPAQLVLADELLPGLVARRDAEKRGGMIP